MWSWMLWGSRLHFRSSELYQCLTSLVTRGKVKHRFLAVHVFFVGKAWTVRGMLLQVTFFPGKCSISKAVRLFHCHVWLMLLICSTSPSLRPQRLHMQLTQTQTQSETHTCNNTWAIFHQLSDLLFYFTVDILSHMDTQAHSLTPGSWFCGPFPEFSEVMKTAVALISVQTQAWPEFLWITAEQLWFNRNSIILTYCQCWLYWLILKHTTQLHY